LGGRLSVREKNSCADLTDTIQLKTLPSPEAGTLQGSTTVCTGENSTNLKLLNYSGVISNWQSSSDNSTWSVIPNGTPDYVAQNLDASTSYRVIVGKGDVCPPDTSNFATIAVDQKTVGGLIDPPHATLCAGQDAGETLTLAANTGSVLNWQYSTNGINWNDVCLQLEIQLYRKKYNTGDAIPFDCEKWSLSGRYKCCSDYCF
jgi:hypothetical protein